MFSVVLGTSKSSKRSKTEAYMYKVFEDLNGIEILTCIDYFMTGSFTLEVHELRSQSCPGFGQEIQVYASI